MKFFRFWVKTDPVPQIACFTEPQMMFSDYQDGTF